MSPINREPPKSTSNEHSSMLAGAIGVGAMGAALAGIVGAVLGVIIGVPIGYYADRENGKSNRSSSDNR